MGCCTADGKEMYILVHKSMLTEFLKNIDACVKIVEENDEDIGKEYFTVELFIIK